MSEHLTTENIELYRSREIDLAARRETETHLANCEACLERVLSSENSVLAFTSLNEALLTSQTEVPFHFSKAELRNYVEDSLDEADRIIYESHLKDCETCQEEFRALRAETATPAPVSQEVPTTEQLRPRSVWAGWTWLTPARAVVAIAIVGLVAYALIQLRRQQPQNGSLRSESQTNQADSQQKVQEEDGSPKPEDSVPHQPPLVVLKDNNREIKLEQDGKITGLEGLDESTQRLVRAALKGEEVPKPSVLNALSSPNIKLMGTPRGKTFQLISPAGKIILDQRPTFRWRPLSGADSYVVSIFDDHFNRVAQSPSLTKSQWTSNVTLKRGRNYSWEVTAYRDAKQIVSHAAPASSATFRILEAEQRNALTKLKRQTPVSHLALGLAYARAGLISDAEGEFRQLVKENPDAAVAKKLLRTVQEWK